MPELAVGAPTWDQSPGQTFGRVTIVSGASGNPLARLDGTVSGGEFGAVLASLDDIDGDGLADLAIGAPSSNRVHLISGVNLEPIAVITGQAGSSFGSAITTIGDADGDDRGDFVIGAPKHTMAGVRLGGAFAYSGGPLSLIWQAHGTSQSAFGNAIALGPDTNHDGIGDVCVGARDTLAHGQRAGRIRLLDAADGDVLRTINGSANSVWFGASVAGLDDVNDDGTPDLLVGREGTSTDAGAAYVFSGAPHEFGAMQVADIGAAHGIAGRAFLADIDGDGAADIAFLDPANRRIGIRMNNGSAGFYGVVWLDAGGQPSDLAFADIDDDDDLDLVVTIRDKNKLLFFRNMLGILFKTGTLNVGRQPVGVAAADLDGDGRLDLAVAHKRDRNVRVLKRKTLNNAALHGLFKVGDSLPMPFEPTRSFAAKVNSGRIDLLAVSHTARRAATFNNLNAFAFAPAAVTVLRAPGTTLTDIAVGDINGDGWIDIACADGVDTAPSIHTSRGDGTFRPGIRGEETGHAVLALRTGDLDRNEQTDIICGDNAGQYSIAWMLNAPQQSLVLKHEGDAATRWIGNADLDRDGDQDVIAIGPDGSMTLLRSMLFDP